MTVDAGGFAALPAGQPDLYCGNAETDAVRCSARYVTSNVSHVHT
jgi:hypothetical protein